MMSLRDVINSARFGMEYRCRASPVGMSMGLETGKQDNFKYKNSMCNGPMQVRPARLSSGFWTVP